ncbi:hypothetical protein GCM10022198_24750 [Klugiella xanthotipulae]|uniref:Uncharacterized protein DUF4229 n=1 Tax=Klugiella xanthotipulae TaxID=244735 RepID=A0A543HZ59_9MICO|nr:DUF4229 domain-containing protein [Klugiella xanthotipulae]TQM63632.1 uncharacterized protein DUF4229 [Klugiella xanthotipulae]
MNSRKTWVLYTFARLAFFVVPLLVLNYVVGFQLWVAAIVATIIATALSVIFLRRVREDASASIYEWRNRDRTEDDIAEDDILDATGVERITISDDEEVGSAALRSAAARDSSTDPADER